MEWMLRLGGHTCGQGLTAAVQCWRIKIRDLDEEKEEGETHGLLVEYQVSK